MNHWNLHDDAIRDVAFDIRRRAIMSGCAITVYVRESGAAVIARADARRPRELPEAWLVGTYTRAASTADIIDDLGLRLMELAR